MINTHEFTTGGSRDLLDGVALNAAEASRTLTLDLTTGDTLSAIGKFSKVEVFVSYTYSAATTVTATATRSIDGTLYCRRTTRNTVSGASSVFLQGDTYTTGAADADFSLEYDVRGLSSLKIVFGGAGADGSDLITVQAVGVDV